MDPLELNTVVLSPDQKSLEILDQTLLPREVRVLHLDRIEDIYEAIRALRVRGAPAIGVCAGYAMALAAGQCPAASAEELLAYLRKTGDYLISSRPTAVNLSWAVERMLRVAGENCSLPLPELREILFAEAEAIRQEDIAISLSIGEIGFSLLRPGCGILTHCNAGTLATAKYGTATAPVYTALARGWRDLRVYCDETRPLLQGARLTALEMCAAGVDTTLLCDNAASSLMASGKIDLIFVGCDRVARNGDAANKIGTYGVAILAKHFGIPFYVLGPTSTIDRNCPTGKEIPVELRAEEEIRSKWYKEPMAPADVKCFNPSFDVTDHSLIAGIITEKGICRPPFTESLKALFE